MARSVKRERQLARERYERQQARRQEAAARRRTLQQGGAVLLAVALVIGGVVALALVLDGDGGSTVATEDTTSPTASPSESPTASPSETAGAGCAYSTAGEPARDVGVPEYDADDPDAYSEPFTATITTNRGDITVDMAAEEAPCTTHSFRHLASEGYYDDTPCHRLTTSSIFVLQCGDPTGSGTGGPGYQYAEENLPADGENNYPAGTLAMANAGPGTNGSQFFLVYKDTTLPPNFTVFGTVTAGLDVVEKVADAGVEGGGGDGAPARPVTIESVRIGKA